MGRLTGDRDRLFYQFDLDAVVPADHLVRRIGGVLDLNWLHGELAPFYSHTGRPSIDPELMMRMLIIGYVFDHNCGKDNEPVFHEISSLSERRKSGTRTKVGTFSPIRPILMGTSKNDATDVKPGRSRGSRGSRAAFGEV